jgi:RND family efflux transporter MFP subunit
LLLAAGLGGAGCRKASPSPSAAPIVRVTEAVAVESRLASNAPTYMAVVRADNETLLSFKVPGVVEGIGPNAATNWLEGAAVRRDQVLAWLKQADFENALAQSQAKAQLQSNIWMRGQELRRSGAISQQEWDVIEANYLEASAGLRQARQNLEDSELRSPIEGAVLARYVTVGETVAAGRGILRLGDLRTLSIELGVSDRAVGRFSTNSTVPVTISSLEGHPPFPGQVTEVGVAARADARLFRVVIKVPNPDGEIRAGMTASVPATEIAEVKPGSVQVPLSALVAEAQEGGVHPLAVFVVDDRGRASLRRVQTGDLLGSAVIVTSGLKAGERVVTLGAGNLHDGAEVQALPMKPMSLF